MREKNNENTNFQDFSRLRNWKKTISKCVPSIWKLWFPFEKSIRFCPRMNQIPHVLTIQHTFGENNIACSIDGIYTIYERLAYQFIKNIAIMHSRWTFSIYYLHKSFLKYFSLFWRSHYSDESIKSDFLLEKEEDNNNAQPHLCFVIVCRYHLMACNQCAL